MTLRLLCRRCFKPECRKARPLCRRTDNPRNVTCTCALYHFPHRLGSGRCIANVKSAERMEAELRRPMRRAR